VQLVNQGTEKTKALENCNPQGLFFIANPIVELFRLAIISAIINLFEVENPNNFQTLSESILNDSNPLVQTTLYDITFFIFRLG